MKKLIVQVDVPPADFKFEHLNRNEPMIAHSKRSMEAYARKYDADYLILSEPNGDHPWLRRFELFTDAYDEYDTILYADYDVIVNDDSQDIFALCGVDDFCVAVRPDGNPNGHDDLGQFNSGVILFGRGCRSHFNNWDYDRAMNFRFKDQQELNFLSKSYLHTKWIDQKWNDYTFQPTSYFHHYKGGQRVKYDRTKYEN